MKTEWKGKLFVGILGQADFPLTNRHNCSIKFRLEEQGRQVKEFDA